MADRTERELEREGSQGDDQARARLLSARLRSGQISEDDVALAAICGHSTALALLGSSAPNPVSDIWCWASDLEDAFGADVAVRAQIAASRWTLPLWNRAYPCTECGGEGCGECGSGSSDPRPIAAIDATDSWRSCELCFDPARTYECTVHNEARLRANEAAGEALRIVEGAAFDEAINELLLEFLREAPRVTNPARLDLVGLLEAEQGLLVKRQPLVRVLRGGLHEFLYLPDSRSHSDIHDERITVSRIEPLARALGAVEQRVSLGGKQTRVLAFPRSTLAAAPPPPLYGPAMWACKAASGIGLGAFGSWALYAAARAMGEQRRPATGSRPRVVGTTVRTAICRALVPSVAEI